MRLIKETFLLISSRLKSLRGDLKQKELADSLGVNRSYIAQVETGSTRPSVEYLMKVSEHFGVSIDWILTGESPDVSKANISELEGYDPEFEAMITFMKEVWRNGDRDMQGWLKIQFKRAFPEFEEGYQKKQGVAGKSTPNGA